MDPSTVLASIRDAWRYRKGLDWLDTIFKRKLKSRRLCSSGAADCLLLWILLRCAGLNQYQSIITCHAAMLWQGYFHENQRNIVFVVFSRQVLLPPLSTPENAPLQEPKGGGGGLDRTMTTDRRYWAKWRKIPSIYRCISLYVSWTILYWTILNP